MRPECIRQVGTYLVDNGELFKVENISFSQQLLQSIQTAENSNISDTSDNTHQLHVTQSVETACCSTLTSESSSSVEKDEEVDLWSEIQDTEIERAGIFDTMFTSADFVEDSERAAVYGHIDSGHCDRVYSFAPAEDNKPISIFLDANSEELSYPKIFWGHARAQSHPVKIHYNSIVKSELRRSDRRVATCIDNLFYKLKKCQMHSVTSKLNVAVRKHKTGGQVFTAGDLRGTDSIEKLIKFDDGYRVLKDLLGSPLYWEKAKSDLYAMIRQLGPAQIFLTLSAAETRWVHLLKMLSEIVDSITLTDEQVSQLTWSDKCRLISSDPVTCARHFDYSIHHFFYGFLKTQLAHLGTCRISGTALNSSIVAVHTCTACCGLQTFHSMV